MNIERDGVDNEVAIDPSCKIANVAVQFHGDRNVISIDGDCDIDGMTALFYGGGNHLEIGHGVRLRGCTFVFEGDGSSVTIGDRTAVWESMYASAIESWGKIVIGPDCLLSNDVRIRNADSHQVLDAVTGLRFNHPRDVVIGDRVWVCENVHILKGATIGSDCVVGAGSVVTGHEFPPGCVVAGNPARVVRTNVRWKV